MKTISIIVPCFNEEECLPLFEREIFRVYESELAGKVSLELLFVDDGSGDRTLEYIREIWERHPDAVRYLSFSRNFGKEAAMYAGFTNATGDYVAVMDADLQDPPALLPEMLALLESGEYDCVATRRVTRKGEPPVRSWFARRFYEIINKISDAEVVDGARDFRLMRREMVDAILQMSEHNRFSKGIFGWVGFRTRWLSYENIERAAGVTKWSFRKLFQYALEGIVDFSRFPLSIPLYLGVGLDAVSGVALLVLLIRRCMGAAVSGLAWLIAAGGLIAGLQFLCIGLLGMYLGRVYSESQARPHYIARESSDENMKKIG